MNVTVAYSSSVLMNPSLSEASFRLHYFVWDFKQKIICYLKKEKQQQKLYFDYMTKLSFKSHYTVYCL